MKELDTDYKLIPMSEITDEAREIAVRWCEASGIRWIGDKQKLASDIMNYAKRYHEDCVKKNEQCRVCGGKLMVSSALFCSEKCYEKSKSK